MNKNGEIIVIEDDPDDREIITEIFRQLNYKNKVCFFRDGPMALEYLNKPEVNPFLILSDLNMPKISGFELRNMIFTNTQLSEKCIPYLFLTTTANERFVREAYSMSIQGFFQKSSDFLEFKQTIKVIMDYWKQCFAPGQYS